MAAAVGAATGNLRAGASKKQKVADGLRNKWLNGLTVETVNVLEIKRWGDETLKVLQIKR